MSAPFKVRLLGVDILSVLKWLIDQNIKCHSIEYDFDRGSTGSLEVEFNLASEATLFKLTWA